jgi:uncharacterized OB-fold protein
MSMTYAGFLPEITPMHQPFWDSVRRHRAELQRCDRCGRFRFIPSERCQCGSKESTWTAIAGTGEVYTYTVVHRAPTPAYQALAPYGIVHVTLDEGPRMISTIVGCEPGAVTVGMQVELVYDDVTAELTLYRFQPRSSPEEHS